MAVTPYVVGQWVRSERFYGRAQLLEEILHGNRNSVWILGTRRIGKTSILKQLEHLSDSERSPYVPLFWDFQGSERVEDLHESFRDALFDAAGRLERLGIELDSVDDADLFSALGKLRRELRSRSRSLLLLGDEAEELVAIHQENPRFLRRLQRALQAAEGIRTVLASTIRLWNLASDATSSSPFLDGFAPPVPVRQLNDDDARALILQTQLPEESRPVLDEHAASTIGAQCANHPYLLQLLSERVLETGDLERAIAEIEQDEMVRFFFANDLAMLAASERSILATLSRCGRLSATEIAQELNLGSTVLRGGVHRLETLGFVVEEDGHYAIANPFFARWFAELSEGGGLPLDADDSSASAGVVKTQPLSERRSPQKQMLDDRYELRERLGSGANGVVFRALDTMLRADVAIKIFREQAALDEDSVERLRREVVLARDVAHPNLLRVYHLGRDGNRHYITMQYIQGEDLARSISSEGAHSPRNVLQLGSKLAWALDSLHRHGVLHRDLKPSNVLMDADGEPHITDFGLARLQSAATVTRSGAFLGTPAYAAPEQIMGEAVDARSDLYALGMVLYELCAGRLPYETNSVRQLLVQKLESPTPDPRRLRADIPCELAELILRCLQRNPESRVQSAQVLGSELDELCRNTRQLTPTH